MSENGIYYSPSLKEETEIVVSAVQMHTKFAVFLLSFMD